MIELQQIIASKRALLDRETCPGSAINYSEGMSEDQKDRYIQYLAEQNQDLRLTEKAMQLVLEDFMSRQKELEEKVSVLMSEQSAMKAELLEERRLRKVAECEKRSLQEQLEATRQELYGKKRQRVRNKASDESENPEPDRNDEKGDYDGTEGSLRTGSVDTACPPASSEASRRNVTCPTAPYWRTSGSDHAL